MNPYYDHGGITIYHGDCREVLPQIGMTNLIVTDPPYGFGRFATDGKDYLETVGPALRAGFSSLDVGGSMFVFCSTGEVLRVGNCLPYGFKRMFWMYKPADMTFPLEGWLLTSEAILWFAKDKPKLSERRPFKHDCYIHNNVGREGVEGHPTVKPLAVVSDLVSRCIVGGIVCDPFLGSGTTLVAAKNHGLLAIGIEIEERYCEIAAKRLSQEVLPL